MSHINKNPNETYAEMGERLGLLEEPIIKFTLRVKRAERLVAKKMPRPPSEHPIKNRRAAECQDRPPHTGDA